jgi:hypothetical protein
VAKVGTSKAGGTISQQAVPHPWLATDAQQTNKRTVIGMLEEKVGKRTAYFNTTHYSCLKNDM